MNARKKLHDKWARELKQWWIDNDYPQYCERCGGTFGCAFAHSRKRRFIDTRELYFECALLCQTCHHWAEYGTREEPGTHERMEGIIRGIIESR